MSVDLVVSGKAGTATRTTPHARVRLFGTVIDEWQLSPTGGAVNVVHMAAIDTVMQVVLVVSSVDPEMHYQCVSWGLPIAMAAQMHAVDLMPCNHYDHVRVVTRQLARAAVDGHLPITPGQQDYARTWAIAVRTLCALTSGPVGAATDPVGVLTG